MVVTRLPATCDAVTWHERAARPSTWTVQAPHKPVPQPNLVPLSLRCSRTIQSSGVSGATSTLAFWPLMTNAVTAIELLPLFWRSGVQPGFIGRSLFYLGGPNNAPLVFRITRRDRFPTWCDSGHSKTGDKAASAMEKCPPVPPI